ncbi:asparaginase [Telmatospirillum sp. J64-1]|uniref:asparaginase n=1 Tax=Telmatospirillum sp. J64-1 TaxID=2502183 RepID=UPI001C8F42C9|nr:asparaginase [Telmatospirillum sp. J64-1]
MLVLSLGGTITMMPSAEKGIVPTLTAADLVRSVEGLDRLAAITADSPFQLPGASLTLDILSRVAEMLEKALASGEYDGAVVVQGTDTIEETAFVLDHLVRSSRPVVVTGAMRGASSPGADGPANILAAVAVAASGAAGGRGTLVVLNDEIHAARFVRKGDTGLTSAFQSSPLGAVGCVTEGRVTFHVPPFRKAALPEGMAAACPPVALLTIGLGDQGELLDALPSLGFGGAVVAAMGAGHVPQVLAPKIEALAARMPVVLSSRVMAGPVFTNTYGFAGSETDLIAKGAIPAGDLGPVKARLLLQLLLGRGLGVNEIREHFLSA